MQLDNGIERKAVSDDIEKLRKKRQGLEKDIDTYVASANDFAEKTEKMHDVTCITKHTAI
jgi:hypothetical protein